MAAAALMWPNQATSPSDQGSTCSAAHSDSASSTQPAARRRRVGRWQFLAEQVALVAVHGQGQAGEGAQGQQLTEQMGHAHALVSAAAAAAVAATAVAAAAVAADLGAGRAARTGLALGWWRWVRRARWACSAARASSMRSMPANTQSPARRLAKRPRSVVSALTTGSRARTAAPAHSNSIQARLAGRPIAQNRVAPRR